MRISVLTAGTTLAAALLLGGCADEEVTTYQIPKVAPKSFAPAPAAQAAPQVPSANVPAQGMTELPGMAQQTAGFTTPEWSAPTAWEAQPLGSMRKGSWKVTDDTGSAEISVLVFPGNVGGDLANVNRWRQQVGLGAITQAQLDTEKANNAINAGEATGFFVTMNGSGGQSITGAVIPVSNATWFFKMSGNAPIVSAQTPGFLNFVRSAKF